MSKEKSYAEDHFLEGKLYAGQWAVGASILTGQPLTADEKADFGDRAIKLLERALSYGLDGRDEIECRCFLGNLHFNNMARKREASTVRESGVHSQRDAFRSLTEYEQALLVDLQTDAEFFSDPGKQCSYLPQIASLWLYQGVYLSQAYGVAHSIPYLEAKAKTLSYFGIDLPDLCFLLGCNWSDVDQEMGAYWFRRGINGNDLGDEHIAQYKLHARDYLAKLGG